jgi:small subunit ribosomal protein S4
VNGRKVDIPSFLVKTGDEIAIRERSRKLTIIQTSLESRKGQSSPEWLDVNADQLTGRVLSIPTRDSIPVPINEQLIVELYSK